MLAQNGVVGVPTNWPENYNMPGLDAIDQEEYDMRGQMTNPTAGELGRHWSLE